MCKKSVNYLTYCAGTNPNLTTEVVPSKGLCNACFSIVISVLVEAGVHVFGLKSLNYGLQLISIIYGVVNMQWNRGCC